MTWENIKNILASADRAGAHSESKKKSSFMIRKEDTKESPGMKKWRFI